MNSKPSSNKSIQNWILNQLNQPFPNIMERKYNWPITIGISLFIALFLAIFQPYNLQKLQMENKAFFLLGYGAVTFLVLVLFLIIIPELFQNTFRESTWKVWKHIIFLSFIILTIGIGNFLYTFLFIDYFAWNWKWFLLFEFFTLIIGIIPITITTLVALNRKLKKNLEIAGSINQEIQHKTNKAKKIKDEIKITGNNKNETIHLSPEQIYFVHSEGNYVHIYYWDEGYLQSKMLRNTLTNIKNQLQDADSVIPCHRAFLVNTDKIEKARGNAQGFTLKLSQTDKNIPVSRKYVPLIRNNLSN